MMLLEAGAKVGDSSFRGCSWRPEPWLEILHSEAALEGASQSWLFFTVRLLLGALAKVVYSLQ
jgi:hypothetical protein